MKLLDFFNLRKPKKPGIIKKPDLSSLDYHCSIVVEEEELGNFKTIIHEGREIEFKVPSEIDGKITVRLLRLGKTEGNLTGNLLVDTWLNGGEDVNEFLWLSASSAWNGTTKNLWSTHGIVQIVVPKGSFDGAIIEMKGLGKEAEFWPGAPFHRGKRGDLLVKLRTYPDYITPKYRSFHSLDTDAMALEGWIYRKIDEIISTIGESILNIQPITADMAADVFNEKRWKGLFNYLIDHFNLANWKIEVVVSNSISKAGECQQNEDGSCKISINGAFIDNPICVTAILAHELCHEVYRKYFCQITQQNATKIAQGTLEEERIADLLIFMYGLGGFQIRVSRDKHITVGYFDQETFDRIYVIVSKELKKRRYNRAFGFKTH